MTKVLYVMGAGRSGSTLLGVMLENCGGLFYAGELDAWLRREGVPNHERADVVAFWDRVGGRVETEAGADVRELGTTGALDAFEHSTSLFRPAQRRLARKLRHAYERVNRSLLQAIAAEAGCRAVVDTAHYPLRARALRRVDGLDVYLVFLTRDPHGVVDSFARNTEQGSKSPLAANVYLWLTNFMSLLVFLTHPRERRLFVSYEELVETPAPEIAKITQLAGEPSSTPDFSSLSTGRAFQGNRLLQSDSITLRSGERTERPKRWLTSVLQSPWSLAFRWLEGSAA